MAKATKKGFLGIRTIGLKDFLIKPEMLKPSVDCGFKHPSTEPFPTNKTVANVLGLW